MGIESTTEGAVTKIENDVKNEAHAAENVIANEAMVVRNDLKATISSLEASLRGDFAKTTGYITTKAEGIKKDVTGYVTTFEQDARSFEVASRGALVRFFAKIFRF